MTDANYTEYVRVIGALLRLPSVPTAPPGAPKHLDFDDAEATWLIYRKQSCMAMETWGRSPSFPNHGGYYPGLG